MNNRRPFVGYVLLSLSLLIMVFYNFQRAEVHFASAWDTIGNAIVRVLVYGTAGAIGLAGLLSVKMSVTRKKTAILIVYMAAIAGSFYYLHVKTTENNAPVYLLASDSRVTLKLRIDSTF